MARPATLPTLPQLLQGAQPIIARYSRRAREPDYGPNIVSALKALTQASEKALEAAGHLYKCQLDSEHAEDVSDVLSATSGFGSSISAVAKKLTEHSQSMKDVAWALSYCTLIKEKRQKGRPSLIHLPETAALMKYYEAKTGAAVPFPKAYKGTATQHSDRFLAQALKLINPRITTSMAITLIRRVKELADYVDVSKIQSGLKKKQHSRIAAKKP